MAVKQRLNSRQKGASGEREFAKLLRERGLEARRGQQFSGGKDSPDVICDSLTGVHWEVKRVQAGSLYEWLKQATADAGPDKLPIVAHRKNKQEWVAIVPMDVMLDLLIMREGFHL